MNGGAEAETAGVSSKGVRMSKHAVVLIVEDDVEVAELTCEVVEIVGVAAVYRTSVTDAIEYLARNTPNTVGLITDINLAAPMSGIELAVYAAAEWPALAICVISGMTAERPRRLPASVSFIPKPWRAADIVAFVERAVRR